jgi:hypothetical protein
MCHSSALSVDTSPICDAQLLPFPLCSALLTVFKNRLKLVQPWIGRVSGQSQLFLTPSCLPSTLGPMVMAPAMFISVGCCELLKGIGLCAAALQKGMCVQQSRS